MSDKATHKVTVKELNSIVAEAVAKQHKKAHKPLLRDAVGVFTALLIIIVYLAHGLLEFSLSEDNKFTVGFSTALLGLASTAMGFLLGKRHNTSEIDDEYRFRSNYQTPHTRNPCKHMSQEEGDFYEDNSTGR